MMRNPHAGIEALAIKIRGFINNDDAPKTSLIREFMAGFEVEVETPYEYAGEDSQDSCDDCRENYCSNCDDNCDDCDGANPDCSGCSTDGGETRSGWYDNYFSHYNEFLCWDIDCTVTDGIEMKTQFPDAFGITAKRLDDVMETTRSIVPDYLEDQDSAGIHLSLSSDYKFSRQAYLNFHLISSKLFYYLRPYFMRNGDIWEEYAVCNTPDSYNSRYDYASARGVSQYGNENPDVLGWVSPGSRFEFRFPGTHGIFEKAIPGFSNVEVWYAISFMLYCVMFMKNDIIEEALSLEANKAVMLLIRHTADILFTRYQDNEVAAKSEMYLKMHLYSKGHDSLEGITGLGELMDRGTDFIQSMITNLAPRASGSITQSYRYCDAIRSMSLANVIEKASFSKVLMTAISATRCGRVIEVIYKPILVMTNYGHPVEVVPKVEIVEAAKYATNQDLTAYISADVSI